MWDYLESAHLALSIGGETRLPDHLPALQSVQTLELLHPKRSSRTDTFEEEAIECV